MSRPQTPAARQAPPARPRGRWMAAIEAWRDAHLYSLFSSIGRMMLRPWATALTVGVIAVAWVLPLCLMLLIGNVERLSGSFRESREVSLFLSPAASAETVQTVAQNLRAEAGIAELWVRTPEQGLEEFREMADFADALALLDDNPLPAVLVVTPAAGVDPLALAQQLQTLPEVEFVQHDALWRARLTAWLALGRRLAWLVGVLLGIGVLLVVGNTVRLDIQGRAEEIQTVQLLGATDGFVRRPFLYLGAWYGLLAGLVAVITTALIPYSVQAVVAELAASHGSNFRVHGLSMKWMVLVQAVSIALGWLGAWLATGHHLRHSAADVEKNA